MIEFRYSFKEQVREVFSNKIKYLSIIVGSLDDPTKTEYFFLWWKITILKSNDSEFSGPQYGPNGSVV